MATDKQVAANRLNASKSTGPKSALGKRRSRLNALRHGLTAETVITIFENAKEYRRLETDLVAEYSPRTPLEKQLVIRLASLVWRVRRAAAIETGLFQIEAKNITKHRSLSDETEPRDPMQQLRQLLQISQEETDPMDCAGPAINLARAFLGVRDSDPDVLKRIGRYETGLWRQIVQTMLSLNSFRWTRLIP